MMRCDEAERYLDAIKVREKSGKSYQTSTNSKIKIKQLTSKYEIKSK